MNDTFNIIQRLTSNGLEGFDRNRILSDFAKKLGWRPSDILEYPETKSFVNANLIVEHGLEHSSVITFLNRRYKDLSFDEKNNLIAISYNNLVDWHIHIDSDSVRYIYNRTDPPKVVSKFEIDRQNLEHIRSDIFEKIIGKKPNPNVPALDEALIDTISFWKRNLDSLISDDVTNKNLASLFNSIIFLRAIEDYFKKIKPDFNTKFLIYKFHNQKNIDEFNFSNLIIKHLEELLDSKFPENFIDKEELNIFSSLKFEDAYELVNDFYNNKYASHFKYDFSLISKHALSNIYEHYVTLLRYEETEQLTLFQPIPFEEREKKFGAVYTPQYIARFFGRYLEAELPTSKFRKLKSLDPACGSGIFLRTLLELQCDIGQWGLDTETIKESFKSVHGFDIDENASQATKLSISLLYLILLEDIPSDFNIYLNDSLELALRGEHKSEYDVILCNPPYVAFTNMDIKTREKLSLYLGNEGKGKLDLYLAFIKYSVELLKPGGYGMFVIPHSFLFSKSAKLMREFLVKNCWIKFVADMSSIKVFGNNDIYVILLIFQKKNREIEAPDVTILKCNDFPGLALQDVIDDNFKQNDFYKLYQTDQSDFFKENWVLISPNERSIYNKFDEHPKLDLFLQTRTGFISGNDEVFIVDETQISALESEIFIPFIPDREVKSYKFNSIKKKYFFYPYLDGNPIDSVYLEKNYPKTWKYLKRNKEKLSKRKPVMNGGVPWWRPTRPRLPENMLVRKIITPHLVLTPKFALDETGEYGITRSPILYLNEDFNTESDLLYYFLGVLNSSPCFWFISNTSHKYSSDYLMLEPKTLKEIPVPDPREIGFSKLNKVIKLTKSRLYTSGEEASGIELELDLIISDLYNLSNKEKEIVGILSNATQ